MSGHRPCVCPDWTTTLHAGELACDAGVNGKAAQCYVCGGCKTCRLLAEGYAVRGQRWRC